MHHPGDIVEASQNTGLSMSPFIWFLILIGVGVAIVYYLIKKKK